MAKRIVIPLRVASIEDIVPVARALRNVYEDLDTHPTVKYVEDTNTFCAHQILKFRMRRLEIRVWVSASSYDDAHKGWLKLLNEIKYNL